MATVKIRRSMDSYNIAEIDDGALHEFKWTKYPGGNHIKMRSECISALAPQSKIQGYIDHSGQHREEWMNVQPIRVVILKSDNDPDLYLELKKIVGPKPGPEGTIWDVLRKNMETGRGYSFEEIEEMDRISDYNESVIRSAIRELVKLDLLEAIKDKRPFHYKILSRNDFRGKYITEMDALMWSLPDL